MDANCQADAPPGRTLDKGLRRDLKVLAKFVALYCKHKHKGVTVGPSGLKAFDVEDIAGRPVQLCSECSKLLAHAFVKRSVCPFDPKPACKHCTQHCYHPKYREQMRTVMKYSGRRLVLSGRLDYLFHLFS